MNRRSALATGLVLAALAAPEGSSLANTRPTLNRTGCPGAVVYHGVAPTALLDLMVVADSIAIRGMITCHSARQKLFSDVYGSWWYWQNAPPTNDHPPAWVQPVFDPDNARSKWRCTDRIFEVKGARGGHGYWFSCANRKARITWRQWDKYLNYPS